jgi:hypothetical protein
VGATNFEINNEICPVVEHCRLMVTGKPNVAGNRAAMAGDSKTVAYGF